MIATSLPQNDSSAERKTNLEGVRQQYSYNRDYGIPIASQFYERDKPSTLWTVKVLRTLFKIRSNYEAILKKFGYKFQLELPKRPPTELIKDLKTKNLRSIFSYYNPDLGYMVPEGRADKIEEYSNVFQTITAPAISKYYNSDEGFAHGFVAGPNPIMVQRMNQVPAYFPITTQHLQSVPALASMSLNQALAAGRIFYCDYRSMSFMKNGKHPQPMQKYIYAPLVAFAVPQGAGALVPFAIQTGPTPDGRQIYTPKDGVAWKIARGTVLVAHNCYHEMLTHLGYTHLLIEPIVVATRRQLSERHPIYVLLDQHFEGTMPINFLAVSKLIQPGESVDRLVGSDKESNYRLIAEQRLAFSFRGNYVPQAFERKQITDSQVLKLYPYRDDALLVWNATRSWVADYVSIIYTSDSIVSADSELQAWAAEISSPTGGQVKDFGRTPGGIVSRDDLIEILTMIIFTAGPQHAAVNFAQASDSGFLPANPLAGYIPEIKGTQVSESDWLQFLPPLDVAIRQAHTSFFLGSVYHGRLGYYGNIFGGATEDAMKRFQKKLGEIDGIIDSRNKSRIEYAHLKPSNIPQSINI